ncbi:hypothetical protein ACJJTC_016876 [Scirpophaga incertulas]
MNHPPPDSNIVIARTRLNVSARKKIEAQQSITLRTILKAPRYVRNDVIRRDLRIQTIAEFAKTLAANMFGRAAKSSHPAIKDIAPQHTRPPDGRKLSLPRDLLEEE